MQLAKNPFIKGVNVIDKLTRIQESNGAFYQSVLNETGMINAHMWSILAIASDERVIPNRKKAKEWLLSQQNPDGGFGWVEGAESDTDDTGVAIQALVVLGEDPQNSEVISKALDFIKSYQSADGGFSAGEWMGKESNTASDAWVLQGLFAAKENPLARKCNRAIRTV